VCRYSVVCEEVGSKTSALAAWGRGSPASGRTEGYRGEVPGGMRAIRGQVGDGGLGVHVAAARVSGSLKAQLLVPSAKIVLIRDNQAKRLPGRLLPGKRCGGRGGPSLDHLRHATTQPAAFPPTPPHSHLPKSTQCRTTTHQIAFHF
jgi:hypothetical protein